jgi:hypothetical protein
VATRKRNRMTLHDKVVLLAKLEEIALREKVREEFDVLDKRVAPLRKQTTRATTEQIDSRTIELFKELLSPNEELRQSIPGLLDLLEEDDPPPSENLTEHALGFMRAIVQKAQEHRDLVKQKLAVTPESPDQKLRRELIAALSEIELPKGRKRLEGRTRLEVAGDHLKSKHPKLWTFKLRGRKEVRDRTKGGWFRQIMTDSQPDHD